MSPTSELAGQVAIVTGGSRGIGYDVVRALLGRGCKVAAVARHRERLGVALRDLPKELRDGALPITGDVADEQQVAAAVDQVLGHFGRIDILVNAAGSSLDRDYPLTETSFAQWERLLTANLTGTYLFCRFVLPYLSEGGGQVINVLSLASYRVLPGSAPYSAAKYGARALTEGLISEYATSPVRIASVTPGRVNTEIWDDKADPPSDAERQTMLQPRDITDAVLWLLERPVHVRIPNVTVTPWEGLAAHQP